MQAGTSRRARDYTGRSTIAGIFHSRDDAERAIHELRDAGFRPEDVGVAMRDRTAQNQLVEDTHTRATEGAVSGALGGGLLGGVVGFLVGVGALAIPGLGPVVAGGALAATFGLAGGTAVAGAGIGAAAGGMVGALVGMGIPEEEAQHLESGFRAGGILVTVRGGERALEALAILERHGADTGPGSVAASDRPAAADHATASPAARQTVVKPHATDPDAPDHSGAGEIAGGTIAGAAAGAVAGSAIAGPVGTIVGGAIGAVGGGAAGKSVHENRDPRHDDKANEGAVGGAIAGGAAGAAIGTVLAGPVGTAAGAAIGGAAGAVTGAEAGADEGDDKDKPATVIVR